MALLRPLLLSLLTLFATASPLVAGNGPETPPDWSQVSEEAEAKKLPIAILFTAPDCGYCDRLLNEVIQPAFSGGQLTGRALVREISIQATGKLTDFDGEPMRAPLFVKRYGVFATPTLVLVAPSGEPLAPAVVGYATDSGTYEADLSQALTQATALLRTPGYKDALARSQR